MNMLGRLETSSPLMTAAWPLTTGVCADAPIYGTQCAIDECTQFDLTASANSLREPAQMQVCKDSGRDRLTGFIDTINKRLTLAWPSQVGQKRVA